MDIKHLVLSGGAIVGLIEYGILKNLSKKNIIKYENIKSIYATSIGGYIALIYMLNYDWDWMDDFIIKRPWDKLLNFTSEDFFNLFYAKGLLDEDTIIEVIKPLLLAKDISINVTLKELYDIIPIDLYLFCCNLNEFSKIKLHHSTHPNLKLYEALYISGLIPILFKPKFYNKELYIDGGIIDNCPFIECLKNEKCKDEEMLVLINDKKKFIDLSNNFYIENNYLFNENSVFNNHTINENDTLIDFFIFILKSLFNRIFIIENDYKYNIKYLIHISLTPNIIDLKYWKYVSCNSNERKYLIELGIKESDIFIIEHNKI